MSNSKPKSKSRVTIKPKLRLVSRARSGWPGELGDFDFDFNFNFLSFLGPKRIKTGRGSLGGTVADGKPPTADILIFFLSSKQWNFSSTRALAPISLGDFVD